MKRTKLNKRKIGIVFGTFAPMHTGHVNLITLAKRENEQVLVVVSGTNTERDRGTQIGLNLDRRFRYIREVFRDDELVIVDKLDEKDIPAYPDGWEPWLELLNQTLLKNLQDLDSNIELTFYVGEMEYVHHLENHFTNLRTTTKQEMSTKTTIVTNAKVVLAERSSIPISATKIREKPLQYWRYITKPFRRHFTKKVLVAGSASGGKTTLVKDLGRVFNAPISLEYAREYQDKYNVRDEELTVKDYVHLLADQYQQTANVIDEGSHSGIVFADTNSSVTMAYINHYLKDDISSSEFNMLKKLYEATVAREKWDLILYTLPTTEYVDDGFRDMSMSDQGIRDAFTQNLLELLEPFKDKIVFLDGKGDTLFVDNYEKALDAIADKLDIYI